MMYRFTMPRDGNSSKSRGMLLAGLLRNKTLCFAKNEQGALLIFGLILFLLMTMMGGIAVDLMRYEQRRTEMQQTLDRSVLAAASMTQELDPVDVVNDYFAKAGLTSYLQGVTAEEGLNYRDVKATTKSTITPFFMHLVGIDKIDALAGSGATQRTTNVEISMVLDISGSMGGSRINNLRPAAREFIDTVLGGSEPGRMTISIIPYNATVNIGKPMMDQFNVTDHHTNSYCVELPDSVFNTIDLSRTTAYTHNAHFDPYSGSSTSGVNNLLYHCAPDAGNTVLPISDDANALKARINALIAEGNTSIDLGVKWGALLLNSNAQPVVSGMVDEGAVKADYADRPVNPNVADVMKVLIVMTDGQNTTEYKINDPYNTGLSNVYRRNSNGAISVYHDRSNTSSDYYNFSTSSWKTTPDGGTTGATQQTWPQVWAQYSVAYVARRFFSDLIGNSQSYWTGQFRSYVSSNKNSRLQQICTAAKAQGIIIYGIGFEAPTSGRDELRACASTASHYFDASGLEISTVFRSIASNISQLRLTQ